MSFLSGETNSVVGDCYVYKAIKDVEVRCAPSLEDTFKTGRWFMKGDMVSVDFIKACYDTNGPFLRLSDGSGWVFERAESTAMMKRMPVETGLWSFYVYNHHTGIYLRNHPIDKLQKECNNFLKQIPEVALKPNIKIYCDRKVEGRGGVNFFRLQQDHSKSPAWVFDKRVEKGREHRMLLPESKVQTGLFAFQSMANISIRTLPSLSNDAKTNWIIRENDIVVCDLIQEAVQHGSGNGPFLRLTDGTGWLFVYKRNKKLMRQITIEEGKWSFCVANPHGMQLRKQPIDDTKSRYSTIYKRDEVIHCDRMITTGSSKSYYRVEGTEGWVFDRRKDFRMLWAVPAGGTNFSLDSDDIATTTVVAAEKTDSDVLGWTIEFVRGVATGVLGGLGEIIHDQENKMIAFRHPEGPRINVYYATRSIGIVFDQPNPGKAQLLRHNCTQAELAEVLKNPGVHPNIGEPMSSSGSKPRIQETTEVNAEDDFRNRLMEIDKEVYAIEQRKKVLWTSLDVYEARREEVETKMRQKTRAHAKMMLESLVLTKNERRSNLGIDENQQSSGKQPEDDDEEEVEPIKKVPIITTPRGDGEPKIPKIITTPRGDDGEPGIQKIPMITTPRGHGLECGKCGKKCRDGHELKLHILETRHW